MSGTVGASGARPSAPIGAAGSFSLLTVGPLLLALSLVAVDPWGWDHVGPLRFLMISLGCGVLAAAVARRDIVVVRRPTTVAVALVAWIAVSAVWAVDPLYAWLGTPDRHFGVLTWALLLACFVGGQTLVGERDVRLVTGAVVVVGGLVATYALIELLGWEPFGQRFAGGRLGGPFAQPAYLGAAMVVVLPIAVATACDRERHSTWRAGAFAVAVLAAVACLGSGTRGAWVGLLVMGCVAAWSYRSHLREAAAHHRGLTAGAGLAVLMGVAVVALATPVGDRAAAAFDFDSGTTQGRLDEWRVGAAAVPERPLLGAGPEGYRVVFADVVDATYERRYTRATIPDRAHNGPLDVALAGGLPAGLLYVAFGALVLRRVGRAVQSAGPAVAGVAFALAGYVTQQLFLFPIAELDPLVWLLAGMLVIHTSSEGEWGIISPPRVVAPLLGLVAGGLLVWGVLDVAADHRTASAVRASEQGRTGDARTSIDSAIGLRPDSIRYRFIAARLADRENSNEGNLEALRRIGQGLDLSSDDPALLTEQARLLTDRATNTADAQDIARALDATEQLAAEDPNNAGHQLRLGVVLAIAGDVGPAAERFVIAANLAPNNTVPLQNLSQLADQTGDVGPLCAALDRAATTSLDATVEGFIREQAGRCP